jgi:uncharacterized protein CbrC (UPF0167 family)
MNLPIFKYHPNPIATGSVEPSENVCEACGQSRGFIYKGPVYAEAELIDAICPWCIDDGTAHEKFAAEFFDSAGIGGYGEWAEVSGEIVAEVACRTPGFDGWQQERWFTHCGDAGEFWGAVGKVELEQIGAEAVLAIKTEIGFDGEEWENYFQRLDKNKGPTAYIFKCRNCGKFGGYSDIH